MRETFPGYGGQEIDTQGDAFFYSFPRARDAVAAAVDVQRAHAKSRWPGELSVRLRIGLHTGEPAVRDEGYTGLDVVRASRLAAIGRGGQVLLSDTTRAIVANDLPEGVRMRPLGERKLRDIEQPEPLTELVIPDVEVSPETDALWSRPGTERPRTEIVAPMPPGAPAWLSGPVARFVPGGGRARDLIEQRVLSAIDEAFQDKQQGRGRRRARATRDGRRTPAASRSLADEIDRLRALREAGALTEEQYQRAVDRVVGSDSDR